MIGLVLGLASGVTWGLADFCGGFASRRMNAAVVAAITQTVGMALVAAAVVVMRPTLPPLGHLGLGALAGVAGGLGVWAFYRGLAIGTMSLVAPVSALGAGVPIVVGLALGERPSALSLAGAVVALAGAVLASRAPGRASTRGVGMAMLAAAAFGAFFVLIEPAARTSILWAGLSTKVASVPMLIVICLASRQVLRVGTGLWPFILVSGSLDLIANVLFAAATQYGDISIVSVLAGLYPVTTVILAQRVLHERLSALQASGVGAALVGVALIAAG